MNERLSSLIPSRTALSQSQCSVVHCIYMSRTRSRYEGEVEFVHEVRLRLRHNELVRLSRNSHPESNKFTLDEAHTRVCISEPSLVRPSPADYLAHRRHHCGTLTIRPAAEGELTMLTCNISLHLSAGARSNQGNRSALLSLIFNRDACVS